MPETKSGQAAKPGRLKSEFVERSEAYRLPQSKHLPFSQTSRGERKGERRMVCHSRVNFSARGPTLRKLMPRIRPRLSCSSSSRQGELKVARRNREHHFPVSDRSNPSAAVRHPDGSRSPTSASPVARRGRQPRATRANGDPRSPRIPPSESFGGKRPGNSKRRDQT